MVDLILRSDTVVTLLKGICGFLFWTAARPFCDYLP